MSYARKPDFDRPNAEDIERSRRINIWLIPILLFQQGSLIFSGDRSAFSYYVGVACWASMLLVELAIFSGWWFRWLSDQDNSRLNDERHQAISGDAARWGLAAIALLGVAIIIAERRLQVEASKLVFALVNAGMLTAGLRYAWLNRGEPEEDE